MHISRVFVAFSAIVALGACNGDSTAPSDTLSDQQMSADIAASSAPAVATGAAFFAQAEAAGSTLASVVVPSTMACTMHSNSGTITFSQAESHPDSVAYDATWEYFAGGVCQNMFVVASTDSIAFTAALLEVDNDPRFVARATRNWVLDVTGSPTLASATSHVWNATGLDADTATHQTPGLDRTYIGAAYDTASDVTFPNPRNGVTAPTSGTLTRWVTLTVTHTTHGVHKVATVSRHIVVTFNGQTQIPLGVFDAMRGTQLLACTLDLTARRIVTNSCR
ncbi:MAG TPA: hypothetical protein VK733_07165 [Gemmatimonadaceae bacterium]|jgi:hypothetical protein|nr:hypothetical protein [Gemmatimonadaceae bacterium]